MSDFREVLAALLGGEEHVPLEFPEFQPNIWWHKGVDFLTYETRDCSYVRESFGWYCSVLLAGGHKQKFVGVVIEPFSVWVDIIRKTYPGIGIDGRDFPLWPLIELATGKDCLFPRVSQRRVRAVLPKIREFVGIVTIPFQVLQEVRYDYKTMPSVAKG
ncbi:MAG: hypothetical protein IPK84_04910 [Candidatus Moraniibacteriota bacterium]|nr:MAG: hypothetical protein IPK84_04910 [Candidatus Moranbacteria bacterium]